MARRLSRQSTIEEVLRDVIQKGGFGGAVLEMLEQAGVSEVRVKRLGIPDEFVPHGKQEFLRSLYHLDPLGIARECVDLLARVQAEVDGEVQTTIF